ncbi:porin [Salmonella enterica]|nr:porin [Salmonella enterica]EKK6596341.1 porin [Salmonella enterica]
MKSKLALLVLSALALGSTAHAAEIYNKNSNKLDLYGKVKGERDFTTTGNHDNADATYVRLGFKGETQINDSLTGYGQFEHQFNASDAEGSQGAGKTRLAFAGLNFGDAGSIDYGRNYGVVYDIGAYADNLTEFGGDSYQYTDNFMTGRSNGLLTYRNNKLIDGLSFGLQYQGKNESSGRTFAKENGNGFGTSLQYEILDSGVTVGAAYANSETTSKQQSVGAGKHAEAWTVGAKYDANSIYLATTYAETRNMTPLSASGANLDIATLAPKAKNLEVMAGYVFDFGLNPTVGYVQSKVQGHGQSVDAVKYAQVGAAYYFNKNFSVDAAYKFNLLNGDSPFAKDDQAVVGATYQF